MSKTLYFLNKIWGNWTMSTHTVQLHQIIRKVKLDEDQGKTEAVEGNQPTQRTAQKGIQGKTEEKAKEITNKHHRNCSVVFFCPGCPRCPYIYILYIF